MDKTVRLHIQELEARIHQLSVQMMDERNARSERNRLEAELRVAQQALEHYRQALEFEKKLQTGAGSS